MNCRCWLAGWLAGCMRLLGWEPTAARYCRLLQAAANTAQLSSERSAAERGILIVPKDGIALYREPEDPSPDGSG